MAIADVQQACIVQRSQANGRTLSCVNCLRPVGKAHKIGCYEAAKALQHVHDHQQANPNCDYCTGRM